MLNYRLGVDAEPKVIGTHDILGLIRHWSDEEGKVLCNMVMDRDYYKRILTIHSDGQNDTSLLARFRTAVGKPEFAPLLQSRLRDGLEQELNKREGPAGSSLAAPRRAEAVDLLLRPGAVLCDCPRPPLGSRDKLRFIPEPERVQHNYLSRVDVGERVSEVWDQVFTRLMTIASKGRVYCHPQVRDTLFAAMGPEDVSKIVDETMRKFE